jgi:nitrite reductase/ring-hydroxylating ferredoxin subunit
MKPYIEINGEKVHLPQSVDPHKFEVCSREFEGNTYYILCKKVSQRYQQATGVVLERKGKELDFHLAGNVYVQHTFPLSELQIHKINIDWNAGGSISIQHEE